jgi:exopolysaccharide production protein ExoQ
MKPPLALLCCLPLIIWFWKRDQKVRPQFSGALWLSLIWLLILGSRSISFWLGIGYGDNLEGNSFDRTIYLVQILAAMYIVSKRGIDWGALIRENKGILIFYLFLAATMFWSEYPFVTLRRWFKDLGSIFLILVILTEKEPIEAIKATFARCAYILFPLSVIFIKYFPALGREYTRSGEVTYTGVTTQKNALGEIVLVFGLLLVAELIQRNRPKEAGFFKRHHFTIIFAFSIGIWLLLGSHSQTSLICFLLGTAILLGDKIPFFKGHPQRQMATFFTMALLFFLVNNVFELTDELLRMVGRDPTLTHRTEIWQGVKENPVDPLFGCGYLMFWDLHRGIHVGDWEDVRLTSAHNGYLEIYLDGGALGLFFLAIMLLAVGIRVCREFLTGSEHGRLAFAFYVIMLLYNVSESMYARRSPLWFAFLLFCLKFPPTMRTPVFGTYPEHIVTAQREPATAYSNVLSFLGLTRQKALSRS